MSSVTVLARQISEVNRQIAVLEDEAIQYPDDRMVQYEAASFRKRQTDLVEQFDITVRELGVAVCKYRLFGVAEKAFGKVCQTIAEFQRLYTLVFSAIKSGKRTRRQAPVEDERLSAFGFAYTFAGSIGVTLTLAQQRSLFDEEAEDNQFDEAMGTLCDLAKLDSTEKIKQYAADLGVGVIRELYAWSNMHAEFSLGADIEWMHGRNITRSVLVQPQEMARLRSAIEMTSDVKEEPPFTVTGQLLGADIKPPTFHFKVEGGEEIRGTFTDAITVSHPLPGFPLQCSVEVFRKTIVKYATDEENSTWHLLKLTPTTPPSNQP